MASQHEKQLPSSNSFELRNFPSTGSKKELLERTLSYLYEETHN